MTRWARIPFKKSHMLSIGFSMVFAMFFVDALYNGALNLEVNGSLPSDSIRALFIPDRWRSRFHPLKGFTFSPSQKGHKELPARGSFTLWKTPASFILEKVGWILDPQFQKQKNPREQSSGPFKKNLCHVRGVGKKTTWKKQKSLFGQNLYIISMSWTSSRPLK